MPSVAVQNLSHDAPVFGSSKRCDFTPRLPEELLAQIFNTVKDDSEGAGWLNVTFVDHRWRSVALDALELWKTLRFDKRHSPTDVCTLLWRSGSAGGLDITFTTTRLSCYYANKTLQFALGFGFCARMRRLTIQTSRQGFKGLDNFLRGVKAPHLESVTLDDCTSKVPCRQHDDAILRQLPKLPKLKELRVRGFLFSAPVTTLRQLTTLEVSNTQKYNRIERWTPGMEHYLRDLLNECPNLERLILHNCLVTAFFEDPTPVYLPELQYLEVLHERELPALVYNRLAIPDTAAVHLHTRIDHSEGQRLVLLNEIRDIEDEWPPLSFDDTTALAFHADGNQSVRGWTNPHAAGEPAWSVMGEMRRQRLRSQRKLLPQALKELPDVVGAWQIAHLELHIHSSMPAYLQSRDWVRLLREFAGLRLLIVGGERAARSMLAALPIEEEKKDENREGKDGKDEGGKENEKDEKAERTKPPVLLQRLHEFTLCLDALRDATCVYVQERLNFVPVLRIRLPAEAHRHIHARRKARKNGRALKATMKKTRVRVEYGERCATCHAEDAQRVMPPVILEDSELDVYQGEVAFVEHTFVEHTKDSDEEKGRWRPVDNPDEWSSSSGDSEYSTSAEAADVPLPPSPPPPSSEEARRSAPTRARKDPDDWLDWPDSDSLMTSVSDEDEKVPTRELVSHWSDEDGGNASSYETDGGEVWYDSEPDSGDESDDELEDSEGSEDDS